MERERIAPVSRKHTLHGMQDPTLEVRTPVVIESFEERRVRVSQEADVEIDKMRQFLSDLDLRKNRPRNAVDK